MPTRHITGNAMSKSQSASQSGKAPTSEKSRTIVEVARERPDASNPAIADEVENRIGDRPDPSWVSRVRSKYVDGTDDAPEPSPPPADTATDADVEELMLRVDTVAGRLERFAGNVGELERTIADLERRVDAIEAADTDVDTDDLADAFDAISRRFRDD